MTKLKKRLTQPVLVAVMVIFSLYSLIWALSPPLIRYIANSSLETFGVKLAPESLVRVNLFTSTLSIEDLTLLPASGTGMSIKRAHIHLQLRKLLWKTFSVKKIAVEGLRLSATTQDETLVIGGVSIPNEEGDHSDDQQTSTDETSAEFTIELLYTSFKDTHFDITIDKANHQLHVNEAILQSFSFDRSTQKGDFSFNGSVDEAPISIKTAFELEKFIGEISGAVSLSSYPLAQLHPYVSESLNHIAGEASIDNTFNINLGDDDHTFLADHLNLSLTDLRIKKDALHYNAKQKNLSVTNTTLSLFANKPIELDSNYKLDFYNGELGLTDSNHILASWQNIQLDQSRFRYNGSLQTNIPQIIISGLTGSQIKKEVGDNVTLPPLVNIEQLIVDNIQASDKHLDVDVISLKKLTASAKINSNKKLASLIPLDSLDAQGGATEEVLHSDTLPASSRELEQDNNTFNISLNKLTIDDQSTITFIDESISPNYTNTYTVSSFNIGKLDSDQIDLPTPVDIKFYGEDYSKIYLSGDTYPFKERVNTSVHLDIAEVSLPPLSPYIKDTLGFEVESGQLNTVLSLGIEEDIIKGKNELDVRGLKMGIANSDEESALKDGQAMPLNMALNLLKDKKDNLKLTIPIDGDVNDPNFGIRHFIALIVKKAAMSQAKSYLVNTFVPYAQVVSVALIGADQLLKVRVEPLTYTPGSVLIPVSQETYITQLTQLLIDKPKLYIKTCAISTHADIGLAKKPKDFSADQLDKLIEIGKEREKILKETLIESGIESSRILFCQPVASSSEDAPPQIQIKAN